MAKPPAHKPLKIGRSTSARIGPAAAALNALNIPDETIEYGCDFDTGVLPEDMAAICGWRLGHLRQALIWGARPWPRPRRSSASA